MREKLIHAAIERFGKRGFDAVGTREIAAAVDTPMSSITYHFGGKEGLYHAAAEHIFDYMVEKVGALRVELPGPYATPQQRITAVCARICAVGEFMLSEQSAPFALFIGREQQDPSPHVRELMQAKIMPLIRQLAAQVAILRPELAEAEAKAVTVFLFGMALTLRHSRASLGLLLECEDFDANTKAMLLNQLENCARAVLAGKGA
ncbi:CerR family C-terminal domain-containing protein [Aurantiacibacter rhizosphaerae]|uniref:CerR family C-terminal domain-containing protein n=1 Tax=Aurantiacibacter rhizosphaerae TaxID=2691582 RepID=A0A844XDR9_9SPHN|nr:CerR family C-terminal domain-containing protein [Aurantiacibacter rhizosphaerae]MWV28627.1 CerR family C-terminal domain-containing protein [Aurantiacibacter rhizosphaerae]